jgi:hypothetical protein
MAQANAVWLPDPHLLSGLDLSTVRHRSRRRQNWRNPGPPRWSGRRRRIESALYAPFGPGQPSFKTDVIFSNTLLELERILRNLRFL